MHIARTAAETVAFKHRAYSHRWLTERNLPTQLPADLRPAAERVEKQVVDAVGVSVNFTSPWLAPAADEIRGAMNEVVENSFADRQTDPELLLKRMMEAKEQKMRALFGPLSRRG